MFFGAELAESGWVLILISLYYYLEEMGKRRGYEGFQEDESPTDSEYKFLYDSPGPEGSSSGDDVSIGKGAHFSGGDLDCLRGLLKKESFFGRGLR